MAHNFEIPRDFADRARDAAPEDLLKVLRQQVANWLLERVRTLSGEALKLHSDMEAVLGRLRWHAEEANVGDIGTAAWHRTKTEIETLQQVGRLIGLLQREAPGRPAEVVELTGAGG